MKKLIVLAVVALVPVALWATSSFEHHKGDITTVTVDTIDTDHSGDWERVCSTAAFTALDSGEVVTVLTATALMYPGQKLYVGLDKASTDSAVGDTGLMWATWYIPNDRTTSLIKVPIFLRDTFAADSNAAKAGAVATFGAGSSTDKIIIQDVVLTREVVANKTN